MPVLVTGASGFLGGRLVEMLALEGEQVTILARPSSDLRHLSGISGIKVVLGDITESSAVAEAVRGVKQIFHCAATSTDWAPMETFLQSNVTGTETLLAGARQVPRLERFLHVSTTDVYGYPVLPCAETGARLDVGMPYNRTKILAEEAVWRSSRKGLPVTVVRPATIYGPRGKAFVRDIASLLEARQMAHIDGGEARGGFLYVDNAVDAMMEAARSPEAVGQAYNLTDGTGVRWKEYVAALADGLGCKRPCIDLPYRMAMAMASSMEAPYHWFRKLPGRPLLTKHAVSLLGRDQEFPNDKARTEFDFASRVPFEEGMARSVAWLKVLKPF